MGATHVILNQYFHLFQVRPFPTWNPSFFAQRFYIILIKLISGVVFIKLTNSIFVLIFLLIISCWPSPSRFCLTYISHKFFMHLCMIIKNSQSSCSSGCKLILNRYIQMTSNKLRANVIKFSVTLTNSELVFYPK